MLLRLAILTLWAAAAFSAPRFYTYIGEITTDSVLIAWGKTEGKGNTIGRNSESHGPARVKVGEHRVEVADKNWTVVGGLEADHSYSYEVEVAGQPVGAGTVRTFPKKAAKLTFFVMGDFGTGKGPQYELARVMAREFEKRATTDSPVRFVLTTGDNVYGRWFYMFDTGDEDDRWESTFFEPYEPVLRHVPFYMTLGNHDGNESESREDLDEQLDNFFFPGGKAVRWYSFSFGGLADFFGLDTTKNTASGPELPAYANDGEQFQWLRGQLERSKAPWKIAFFHHPPFSAGPEHRGKFVELRHVHELLAASGVQAVFNGHEHNLQMTDPKLTDGIQYVVTGSGGQLRTGRPSRIEMKEDRIAGWAAQRQFCVVEIDGARMTITPMSIEPMKVTSPEKEPVDMPIVVTRQTATATP